MPSQFTNNSIISAVFFFSEVKPNVPKVNSLNLHNDSYSPHTHTHTSHLRDQYKYGFSPNHNTLEGEFPRILETLVARTVDRIKDLVGS